MMKQAKPPLYHTVLTKTNINSFSAGYCARSSSYSLGNKHDINVSLVRHASGVLMTGASGFLGAGVGVCLPLLIIECCAGHRPILVMFPKQTSRSTWWPSEEDQASPELFVPFRTNLRTSCDHGRPFVYEAECPNMRHRGTRFGRAVATVDQT